MEWLKQIFIGGRLPFNRKYVDWFCYYLAPMFLAILIPFGDDFVFQFAADLGEWGMYLFVLTMLASPLMKLWPKIGIFRLIVSLRRQLGVLIFWLVIGHGLSELYLLVGFNFDLLDKVWTLPVYMTGLIAGLGIVVLGITSNNISVRVLKKNWKKLHYVAYPTLVLAIIHASVVDLQNLVLYGSAFAVYLLLYGAVWQKRKKLRAARAEAEQIQKNST